MNTDQQITEFFNTAMNIVPDRKQLKSRLRFLLAALESEETRPADVDDESGLEQGLVG